MYEIFEKGDPIIDSYTQESLGFVETLVGQIEITRVSNNYSKAKVANEIDLSQSFEPGKYLVRPIIVDEEADEKLQYEEAKKKIEEKRKEADEALSEDW